MITYKRKEARRTKLVIFGVIGAVLLAGLVLTGQIRTGGGRGQRAEAGDPAQTKRSGTPRPVDPNLVTLDEEQLKRIKIEPVRVQAFRVEKRAIGRIAFNEDRTTPVFTPYTGRVVRLIAKPGDEVKPGSPLLEMDTADLVQVESDLINAASALKKAKNQLELARRVATRQEELYQVKAIALKDLEQAQSDLRNAESDVRAAEAAYAAARDRLRLFGKKDAEIAKLEEERGIHPRLPLVSPIDGTITARKVGPGQYVKPDNPDPLFTIADLSTMWLLANVAEVDIPLIRVGQLVEVRVMAYPTEVFRARITYIGASVDPATHRVAVRAEVANPRQKLKPEMFASFRILTNEEVQSPAVPASAIVRDGEKTMVWVEKAPRQFTRRDVRLGLEQNGLVQVVAGVQPGERLVAEGGVFLSNVEHVGYR